MSTPQVSLIQIFPIKSFTGITLQQSEVGIHGLKWDRNFALVKKDGKTITGKRNPEVNHLRVDYDLDQLSIQVTNKHTKESTSFALKEGRFRSNIALENTDPYWEEKLYVRPGIGVRCQIGDVEAIGVAPRVRCTVPPLHTDTSERDPDFVTDHLAHRSKIDGDRLLEYGKSTYYFAVDLFLDPSEEGKVIRQGDRVEIIEEVDLASMGLVR